jgi:uncharacterized membrane protein
MMLGISDLHTLFNYFTVALANIGIVFEIIGRSSAKEHLKGYGWNSLRLALGFAVLSVITGFITESSSYFTREAQFPGELHKILSIGAFIMLIVVVSFRMIFLKKLDDIEKGAGIRGAYITLQIVALVLVVSTSFLGIRLVKGYGVGVVPYEHIQRYMPPPVEQNNIQVDTSLLNLPN